MLKSLSLTPSLAEVTRAVKQMSSGKAPGPDGSLADVFKHGGMKLTRKLTTLLKRMWSEETVPQDFRNANVIHMYSTSAKAIEHNATTTKAFPCWHPQVKFWAESCSTG